MKATPGRRAALRTVSLLTSFVVFAGCGPAARSNDAQAPAPTPVKAEATPAPALPPLAPGGEDFAGDVRLLYRAVACGGDEPLPPAFEPAVAEHCAWLLGVLEKYRDDYLQRATPFLVKLRPAGLPPSVVYPFGGGDLLSALLTYPDGLEYTTVSLEHVGDPRRIRDMDAARLKTSLAELRRRIKGLFAYAESTSENLMQMQKGDIPGQLAFTLVALAAHGYEPVGLRYFRIEPDGTLHYFSADEIEKEAGQRARRLNTVWVSPDFAPVFSDAELTFKPKGAGAEAPLRVHRHVAANLSDAALKKDAPVLRHLEGKGKVAAMTKAASYLLWAEGFSHIRDYLLGHMAFMISDSTGIPAADAQKAGFVLETYGRFNAPFLAARKAPGDDLVKLWADQPYRELPFRYGYPDRSGQNHLLVTRPAAAPPPSPAAVPTPAPAQSRS
jgi:hypothetical protein